MDSPILKHIAKFLQDRKKHKHWTVVFTCMAILVCLGTVTALKLMGQAMTRKEKVLNCSLEVHQHTEECQDEAGNLICGLADYVVHVHNDDCYDSDGNLACVLPEVPAHIHSDECYADEDVLICGFEEEEGHVHDEACYEQQVTGLQCQSPEHTHSTGCYDKDGNLTCTAAEHQHASECYDAQGNLICGQQAHTHMVSCFDENNNLTCTAAEHLHSAECLMAEDVQICELEEGDGGHIHTDDCYETQKVLACGQLELHTHAIDAGCFEEIPPAEEGAEPTYNLICEIPVLEEHVHTEEAGCFVIVESAVADAIESVNGTEVAQSTEAVNATETVNSTEKEEEEFFKACEGNGYIVSATYGADAGIPDEAEFSAELITPESDPEHYAEREAEYRQQTGDAEATMSALLKMGFYINGEEIEPKAPVKVTVQLVNEEGLPEGMPMTIVHFADEGSEVLDGSHVENGKTSFEMGSFSEAAVGYLSTAEPTDELPETIDIAEDFEYTSDEFNITFHIEGEAALKLDEAETPETTENLPQDDTEEKKEASTETEEVNNTEMDMVSGNKGSDADSKANDTETASSQTGETAPDGTEVAGDGGNVGNGAGTGDNTKNAMPPTSTEGNGDTPQAPEDDTNGNFQIAVKPLDKNSDIYKAVADYAEENANSSERISWVKPLSYLVMYKGVELDLSDCNVEAEIILKTNLNDKLGEVVSDNEEVNVTTYAVEVLDEGNVNSVDIVTDSQPVVFDLESNTMALYSATSQKIEITVQFYSYLDVIDTGEKTTSQIWNDKDEKPKVAIPLIDTCKIEGYLPKNDPNLPVINMYLERVMGEDKSPKKKADITEGKTGSEKYIGVYAPIYKEELVEIFKESKYDIAEYPELKNFNKFDVEKIEENTGVESHYDLKEIWVLKPGKSSESKDPGDWESYPKEGGNVNDVVFINNPEAELDTNEILVTNDTVIRLVARSKKGGYNNAAIFYDMDITDGNVYSTYKNDELSDIINDRENFNGKMYADVYKKGINSESNNCQNVNGTPSGRLAFGNGTVNLAGMGYEDDVLGNAPINKANTASYWNCSFGIVQTLLGDDKYPVFNVQSPDIFSPKEQQGKTLVPGYSLDFNRDGDTYTLTSINGSNLNEDLSLDMFYYAGCPWGKPERAMFQNLFWPMDFATSYGANGHDLKFGDKNKVDNRIVVGTKQSLRKSYAFDKSDDGTDHNSYFSMNFALKFKLTKDYVGPLNYYFYGDDDMWVFLDNQLICDIGGVHQVAGEYVDLWNWLEKGSEDEHTLRFFYTERGASGSTCWMQFTLPSVAAVPVHYEGGDCKNTLTVGKTVDGIVTDEEFEFKIQFFKDDVLENKNTYAYQIFEEGNSNPIKTGDIASGGTFKLKHQQSIVVNNLPDGTKYKITEGDYIGYKPEIVGSGTIVSGGMVEGNIDWKKDDEVEYSNVYNYELPETGGMGKTPYTIAGVVALFGAGFLYRKNSGKGGCKVPLELNGTKKQVVSNHSLKQNKKFKEKENEL